MLRLRPMTITAVTLVLLSAAALASADAPGNAGGAAVTRYGAKVKPGKPVDIAALAQAPEKFKGKTVRLEGVVKDVCQGRGCWIEVADAGGTSFLARSLDEKILVPKDCKGYRVVVQGVVKALPSKVKMEKAEGHSCPKPEWVVATRGVELEAPPAQ